MSDILLIDNFDSFTYNLVHYFEAYACEVDVVRNNEIPFDKLLQYKALVLSPGPGLPEEAGDMLKVFDMIKGEIPILGVCLGMQGMALALGGKLNNKSIIHHGEADEMEILNSNPILKDLSKNQSVGLYHSWEIGEEGNYRVDARSKSDGTIMAISNEELKYYALQFHPESILTENGKKMIENFISIL